MNDKTSLYQWENEDLKDLTDIEKESFKKAVELNDKLIDAKTILDEIAYDWKEYMQYLEDERVSKICEFYGKTTIDFNEELLTAIVTTLKESLNKTHKAVDYNSKKIKINRVLEG